MFILLAVVKHQLKRLLLRTDFILKEQSELKWQELMWLQAHLWVLDTFQYAMLNSVCDTMLCDTVFSAWRWRSMCGFMDDSRAWTTMRLWRRQPLCWTMWDYCTNATRKRATCPVLRRLIFYYKHNSLNLYDVKLLCTWTLALSIYFNSWFFSRGNEEEAVCGYRLHWGFQGGRPGWTNCRSGPLLPPGHLGPAAKIPQRCKRKWWTVQSILG